MAVIRAKIVDRRTARSKISLRFAPMALPTRASTTKAYPSRKNAENAINCSNIWLLASRVSPNFALWLTKKAKENTKISVRSIMSIFEDAVFSSADQSIIFAFGQNSSLKPLRSSKVFNTDDPATTTVVHSAITVPKAMPLAPQPKMPANQISNRIFRPFKNS